MSEADQLHEEVEKAAQAVVATEPNDVEAWAAAVGANARSLHTLHPSFSVSVLEVRIGFRAQELVGLLLAEGRRFERDLGDRAKLIEAGENSFNDAVAALQIAYPGKDWSEIVTRLARTIKEQGAQEG